MTDLRQTPEYALYVKSLGWKIEEMYSMPSSPARSAGALARRVSGSSTLNKVFIRHVPILGNIAKLQRSRGQLEPAKLDEFARKNKIVVLYLEPALDTRFTIQDTLYKKSRSCFLPSKTIHINLRLTEEGLFNQTKKKTRYGIRIAQKQGVYVAQSKDIGLFVQMWQKSARKRGMWFPLKKEITALWHAFGDKAHILLASQLKGHPGVQYIDILNNKVLAGVLLARSPDTAYYMYAFSTKEGNKLSAPTLLAWEAIKLAKRQGGKVFDFEGIYDERYPQTKNWKGFTRFKEGFGGKTVTYPEALVRYYNPLMRVFG